MRAAGALGLGGWNEGTNARAFGERGLTRGMVVRSLNATTCTIDSDGVFGLAGGGTAAGRGRGAPILTAGSSSSNMSRSSSDVSVSDFKGGGVSESSSSVT